MTVGLNIEFENDPEKIGIPILEILAKLRNEGAVKKHAEILDWSVPRLLQIDKSFPDLRNVFAIDTSINQTLICYSLKEMIQKRKRVRSFDGRAFSSNDRVALEQCIQNASNVMPGSP